MRDEGGSPTGEPLFLVIGEEMEPRTNVTSHRDPITGTYEARDDITTLQDYSYDEMTARVTLVLDSMGSRVVAEFTPTLAGYSGFEIIEDEMTHLSRTRVAELIAPLMQEISRRVRTASHASIIRVLETSAFNGNIHETPVPSPPSPPICIE